MENKNLIDDLIVLKNRKDILFIPKNEVNRELNMFCRTYEINPFVNLIFIEINKNKQIVLLYHPFHYKVSSLDLKLAKDYLENINNFSFKENMNNITILIYQNLYNKDRKLLLNTYDRNLEKCIKEYLTIGELERIK